jgi:hypothetical protein
MIGSPGTEHPVTGMVTTTVQPPPGFEFRPGAAQLLLRVSDHTRDGSDHTREGSDHTREGSDHRPVPCMI